MIGEVKINIMEYVLGNIIEDEINPFNVTIEIVHFNLNVVFLYITNKKVAFRLFEKYKQKKFRLKDFIKDLES